jgi:homocysteine S-methyltransferase
VTTSAKLPQLGNSVFLTDGGLETDLIFHHGIDLPEFASFVLHSDRHHEEILRNYYREYLQIASSADCGLVLESATWRASSDWGTRLGYDAEQLRAANRRAVQFLDELRQQESDSPVVLSGCVGPRGDAYADLGPKVPEEASRYHQSQIEVLADSGVDQISALTLTNVAEAIGIVQASLACNMPVVISFTVETNGCLPSGTSLATAIEQVDEATTNGPAYYMVNCAHPDHFENTLQGPESSLERIRGVRANASRQSHAELDESETLDDGDPNEFGALLADLNVRHPRLNILGGCCGTDSRHIAAIVHNLADKRTP